MVRDVESWKASLKGMIQQTYGIPEGTLIDQVLANNSNISPTAFSALNGVIDHYTRYERLEWYLSFKISENQLILTIPQIVGYQLYTKPGITWESVEPWERMMDRKYRMFQADVQVHAPKQRTLMNYR